ncbi:trypsin-like peptidase domain-containing protein [Gemmata sp. G18]|uniref:Trypsin-like peptidase domain-containing protein n=1 Tax=Gemmata palustris TaxID=2822762 RepID=A0ABS5BSA4_9BACT|nr:serine protease [Gemmata palustris]MBP3956627.1 trypsin-like peptidase domain-containing protein [Gemmata palustris]
MRPRLMTGTTVRRAFLPVVFVTFAFAAPAPAQQLRTEAPREPKYIDDDEMYKQFYDKLEELAKAGKLLAHDKLVARMKSGPAKVATTKPGDKVLAPEDVYKAAVRSVFIVGSVYPDKDGNWESGTYATAWVAAADGVLVTNWHVFEDLKPDEVFGAADRDGNVYPVTDFIGGDKTADIAVFRIAAKGLTPLPVASGHAEVGSWVGVISHPGDLFYLYTQGTVTRYSTNTNEDGKTEKWMGISAEYASGSSGAPVLSKYGAVVGMAALTLSLDAGDDGKNPARRIRALKVPKKGASRADDKKGDKKDDKPKDPAKPEPHPKGSTLQMVVKMVVPGSTVLKWIGKQE